ncbi:MAG TPA: FG-GAP and VCBS repeat-containing protein [Planctomycetota bacterium]|jgi:hypothetical protein|nr:FG-GAP and VCBS repeat-containing protein [Planctomycetota bacterium]
MRTAAFLAPLLLASPAPAQLLATWDLALTGQAGQESYFNSEPNSGSVGLPVTGGDYNADGFPDVAIGAMLANSGPLNNRFAAGEVYVWWGDGTIAGVFDGATNPPNRITIWGAGGGASPSAGDTAGCELATGDVNGDGVDDLLICAQNANGPGGARPDAGAVYVLFGAPGIAGNIDLASPPAFVTTIHGAETEDRLGIWARAGDVTGDGIDDLLLGADKADGPGNSRDRAGEVYVLPGTATWPAVIDMASPPASAIVVYGLDPADDFGSTVASGDVDGDGFGDLIAAAALNRSGAGTSGGPGIGAGNGPGNGRINCGDTWILFGPLAPGSTIDLASPPAGASTVIYGPDANDTCGEELRAGDFTGDGIADLALGALTADGPGNARPTAGECWILQGGTALRGATIDLASPPPFATVIWGAFAGDIAGDTCLFLDMNADGIQDFAVSSPTASPLGRASAGECHVLFGSTTPLPASIDLLSPGAGLAYARILGAEAGDIMGYSMDWVEHDLDGYADLLSNQMTGAGMGNAYNDAGEAYLVSGFKLTQACGLPTPMTATGEPSSGGTVRFNTPGPVGATVVLAFSLGTATVPLPPLAGTLGLNPIGLFVFHTGSVPATGMEQFPVPVGAVLAPATVYVQALVLTSLAPLAGSFTNVVAVALAP